MADFTAKDVQALRQATGAGMMDAKKALTETGGDMDKRQDYLREQGIAAPRSEPTAPRAKASSASTCTIRRRPVIGVLSDSLPRPTSSPRATSSSARERHRDARAAAPSSWVQPRRRAEEALERRRSSSRPRLATRASRTRSSSRSSKDASARSTRTTCWWTRSSFAATVRGHRRRARAAACGKMGENISSPRWRVSRSGRTEHMCTTRVVLKLSGEAFADPTWVTASTRDRRHTRRADRRGLTEGTRWPSSSAAATSSGAQSSRLGMDRANADYMGMLATVINALALRDASSGRSRVPGADGLTHPGSRRALHPVAGDPASRKGSGRDLRRRHRATRSSPPTRPPHCERPRSVQMRPQGNEGRRGLRPRSRTNPDAELLCRARLHAAIAEQARCDGHHGDYDVHGERPADRVFNMSVTGQHRPGGARRAVGTLVDAGRTA